MNKFTDQGWKNAAQYFQQAVDKDPNYAAAYAGLSEAYVLLGYDVDLPTKEAYEKARAAAERSIALDDTLAEGHAAFGRYYWASWDFAAAEREHRRAIELNPNLALAHEYYSSSLASVGRFAEAEEQGRRAQELDPLSLSINTWLGDLSYYEHDFDKAITLYEKVVKTDPAYPYTHLSLSDAYFAKGMCDQGVKETLTYMELTGYPKVVEIGKRLMPSPDAKACFLPASPMRATPQIWSFMTRPGLPGTTRFWATEKRPFTGWRGVTPSMLGWGS